MSPAWRARLRGYGADAAVLLAMLVAAHLWTSRNAASGPAPELSGPALDGRTLSLADYKGKPVLVQFWATWCGVCKQEEGTIAALARDHAVLTVATDSGSAAEVAAYARGRGLDFPVVVDADQRLMRAYGVSAFPSSFVVDAQGRIRFVEVGYTTSLGLRARLWLAGL